VPAELPWGTLTVNVLGSFAIGLFYALMQQRLVDSEFLRLFVVVGLLGGFTTFSTFSLETLILIQAGLWGQALFNMVASVFSCIAAAFAGMAMARWLI
jgi:CrcB protein